MDCPVCKVTLTMTERSGVEIDYCPQCRGVWLDSGELDKIIERAAMQPPPPVDPRAIVERPLPDRPRRRDDDDDDDRWDRPRRRKREGWLGEIFDF